MAAAMNIIAALGINATLWLQLGIFLVVYGFLRKVVFSPYFKAYESRQGQTQGNQEHAEKLFSQTRELQTLYQRKARSLNADIKTIYDKARLEAAREQEKLQNDGREKAKKILDQSRTKIQEQYSHAREELIKHAPNLGHSMTEKLLQVEAKL